MPINGNRLFIASGHTHVQEDPSSTWTVKHNMGREVAPDVLVHIDGVLEKILPQSQINTDTNTLTVNFSRPFTGKVRVV